MKELYQEAMCVTPEKLGQDVIAGKGQHPHFIAEPSNPGFYGIFKDRGQMD